MVDNGLQLNVIGRSVFLPTFEYLSSFGGQEFPLLLLFFLGGNDPPFKTHKIEKLSSPYPEALLLENQFHIKLSHSLESFMQIIKVTIICPAFDDHAI